MCGLDLTVGFRRRQLLVTTVLSHGFSFCEQLHWSMVLDILRFTAGVGVGSSGACTIGPVPKHQRFWVLLCAPTGCSLAISFLFSLLFLLVCVALQLKSRSLLRYHTPRLCRIAVFSIQPIALSDHDQWGLDSADSVSGGSSNHRSLSPIISGGSAARNGDPEQAETWCTQVVVGYLHRRSSRAPVNDIRRSGPVTPPRADTS